MIMIYLLFKLFIDLIATSTATLLRILTDPSPQYKVIFCCELLPAPFRSLYKRTDGSGFAHRRSHLVVVQILEIAIAYRLFNKSVGMALQSLG